MRRFDDRRYGTKYSLRAIINGYNELWRIVRSLQAGGTGGGDDVEVGKRVDIVQTSGEIILDVGAGDTFWIDELTAAISFEFTGLPADGTVDNITIYTKGDFAQTMAGGVHLSNDSALVSGLWNQYVIEFVKITNSTTVGYGTYQINNIAN